MSDFGVQLWTGNLASYFADCRDASERQRTMWRGEIDEMPPCKHGNQLYVDYQYVGCKSCRAENLR